MINSNNAQFTIENNVLVSEGLTPSVATTVPGAKQYTTVSNATATWISQLGTLSPGWAAQRNFADEGKRQLLGMVSEVDEFQAEIESWAGLNGVDLSMYRVDANFGAYGSLPIIVGVYRSGTESGFILIDGINGQIDGPFVNGTAIDPRGLLVMHGDAYVANTGVSVARAKVGGCVARSDIRTPIPTAPPPGTVPPGWVPIGTPGTPGYGKPSSWKCVSGPTGSCTCTATYNYEPAPGTACPTWTPPIVTVPCIIKVEVICTSPTWGTPCNGGGGTPAPAPPASPGLAPAVPGTGNPPMTGPCLESWYYWG